MTVKEFLLLPETYIPPAASSVAAAEFVGINKITLSGPTLKSATTVDVALFVKVTSLVQLSFPRRVLFTTSEICRGELKGVKAEKLVVGII